MNKAPDSNYSNNTQNVIRTRYGRAVNNPDRLTY